MIARRPAPADTPAGIGQHTAAEPGELELQRRAGLERIRLERLRLFQTPADRRYQTRRPT